MHCNLQVLPSEALGTPAVAAAAAGQRGPARHVPRARVEQPAALAARRPRARRARAAPPHHTGVHLPDVRASALQQARAAHL